MLDRCICIKAPMGDHGLEGYELNKYYLCQRVGFEKGKTRVYCGETSEDYCSCSIGVFKKYFKIINRAINKK